MSTFTQVCYYVFSFIACINVGAYLVMLLVSSAAAEIITFFYNIVVPFKQLELRLRQQFHYKSLI